MYRSTIVATPGTLFALALFTLFCHLGMARAQQPVVIETVEGQVIQAASPQAAEAMQAQAAEAARKAAGEGGRPKRGGPPPKESEGKKSDGPKKEGPKDGKSEEAETIKRPPKPTFAPNPDELTVKPDADGRIQFNFQGQSWSDVLHWLAGVSGMSLDWQELPPDFLNLTTQRSYDLPEARDLLNRHLLSRGFTMLEQGEVLMVMNLKKLDPSLVPRISPDDLEDHPPHAFAKVSFNLPDGLKAEEAMPDVQSLLSPNGKVHALKATNRLLVLDSVANLREVRATLYEEEASIEGNIVPKPFPLQYARAEDVAATLQELLGIDNKKSGPKSPQQMQMEMQRRQMEMEMRRNRGNNNNKKAAPPKKETNIYIVVDRRQNVVLANAPPAEMKIIERAIEILDVPSGRSRSLAGNLVRMKAYRLVSLDPEVTVRMLTEVGDLDPHTRLTVDSKNKSIVAHATVADHITIQAVIEKLDGVGRELEVIWLRRLRANQVAGTLQYLVVGEEKDKNNNNDYGWNFYSRRNRQEEEPESEFRVDADVENNRLLLWANELEMNLVRKLLAKLGEIPGESGDPRTVRVMHALSADDTARVLGDLKRAWKGVAPNPLFVDPGPNRKPAADNDSINRGRRHESSGVDSPEIEPNDALDRRTTGTLPTVIRYAQLRAQPERGPAINEQSTELQTPAQEEQSRTPHLPPQAKGEGMGNENISPEGREGGLPTGSNRPPAIAESPEAAAAPPVTVTVTADGRLVFSCDDPVVLDRLEALYTSLAPPVKDHEVFYLDNVKSYWVWLNLKEYFKDELKDDSPTGWGWFGRMDSSDDSESLRLSKPRKLNFIEDVDTNSILVVNATPEQLVTVAELIEIYDKKMDEDSVSKRLHVVYAVRYSKARVIADAVKEVYRDLLSSKDKEFQNGRGDDQKSRRTDTYVRIYDSDSDADKRPSPVKAGFDGALSLGVDELSNTIIVSAQEELMPGVSRMISDLDEAARPTTAVQLHHIGPRIDPVVLQRVLAETLSQPWTGGQRPEGSGQKANATSSRERRQGGEGREGRDNRRRSRSRGRRPTSAED